MCDVKDLREKGNDCVLHHINNETNHLNGGHHYE
jgi:hypothetical protein